MTTGKPNPPFRMILPKGAPMKKKMMQAMLKVNFLCHSFLCLLMFSVCVLISILLKETLSLAFWALAIAIFTMEVRVVSSNWARSGQLKMMLVSVLMLSGNGGVISVGGAPVWKL